ncbi:uncharacterized protein LOC110938596 isoform X1 [Helianthus annuus]|uniref:uncharacterized protein LOC110938596 isoform X1 n=1 Tax=Helianthus annuus TaxID=4232 RepID=UPI001652F39B|nr:uncharacterized protein LOC110938596 isoform X1 [Helianthus annuus]
MILFSHGFTFPLPNSGFRSHLIPIRLPLSLSLSTIQKPKLSRFRNPKLSLSAIQKPQAFLPLDNRQTCAGFVNDGGCGWKMMTLVGGQIGTILTRSTFCLKACFGLWKSVHSVDATCFVYVYGYIPARFICSC